MSKPNLIKLYDQLVQVENEANRLDRYDGNEEWFHGSSSGMCVRKNYYRANGIEVSNPRNATTDRLLRNGTILHNDFQKIIEFMDIEIMGDLGGSTINNALYSTIIELTSEIDLMEIENEIRLEEYNVRGFYDILVKMVSGEVYLYDVKTMNSWSWKYKFGNVIDPQPALHHQMQLATYGLAVKKEWGRLDGMGLLYYNKDSSVMKEIDVDLSMMSQASEYWRENLEANSKGHPPALETNLSPAYDWECKYCDFKDYCGNDWYHDEE